MNAETTISVGHRPAGKWAFDDGVTACFPDMLRRSVPQYDTMRDTVTRLAKRFVRDKTDVVDLGCSRGDALAELIPVAPADVRFVGVETSDPMLAVCRKRFADNARVSIQAIDLRREYPDVRAGVTLAVLTLQFIPIEHRRRVIQDVFDSTVPGGAFVVVEKVLGETETLDAVFVDEYLAMKAGHGYSREDIERKRMAMEGVLVPLEPSWLARSLLRAGFQHVDCFWRWMNFGGWIALAP